MIVIIIITIIIIIITCLLFFWYYRENYSRKDKTEGGDYWIIDSDNRLNARGIDREMSYKAICCRKTNNVSLNIHISREIERIQRTWQSYDEYLDALKKGLAKTPDTNPPRNPEDIKFIKPVQEVSNDFKCLCDCSLSIKETNLNKLYVISVLIDDITVKECYLYQFSLEDKNKISSYYSRQELLSQNSYNVRYDRLHSPYISIEFNKDSLTDKSERSIHVKLTTIPRYANELNKFIGNELDKLNTNKNWYMCLFTINTLDGDSNSILDHLLYNDGKHFKYEDCRNYYLLTLYNLPHFKTFNEDNAYRYNLKQSIKRNKKMNYDIDNIEPSQFSDHYFNGMYDNDTHITTYKIYYGNKCLRQYNYYIDEDGYDKFRFDKNGFDKNGYNRFGFDKYGFNRAGYNKYGFDQNGKHIFGKQIMDYINVDKLNYDCRISYDINNVLDENKFINYDYVNQIFNSKLFYDYNNNKFNVYGFNQDRNNIRGYSEKYFETHLYDDKGYDVYGTNHEKFNIIDENNLKNTGTNFHNKLEELLSEDTKNIIESKKRSRSRSRSSSRSRSRSSSRSRSTRDSISSYDRRDDTRDTRRDDTRDSISSYDRRDSRRDSISSYDRRDSISSYDRSYDRSRSSNRSRIDYQKSKR